MNIVTGMDMFKMVVVKVQLICRSRTGGDTGKGMDGPDHNKPPHHGDFYLDLIWQTCWANLPRVWCIYVSVAMPSGFGCPSAGSPGLAFEVLAQRAFS